MRHPTSFVLAILLGAAAVHAASPAPAPAAARYAVRDLALPGANENGIAMDYVAFDPATGLVWVPAGNTGAVDVVDTRTGTVKQIPGFPTTEVDVRGRKRVMGPSSVTVGAGTVYVGNRGDATVCAFDPRSLQRRACGHLDSMPDGIAYVPTTKEVWVTTPRDKSVRLWTRSGPG